MTSFLTLVQTLTHIKTLIFASAVFQTAQILQLACRSLSVTMLFAQNGLVTRDCFAKQNLRLVRHTFFIKQSSEPMRTSDSVDVPASKYNTVPLKNSTYDL